MNKTYQPINCNYYDVLLAQATKAIAVKIEYYINSDDLVSINSIVKDVYTKQGEEFMKLSNGEVIRLDKIVSIDNQISPQYSEGQDASCSF